MTETWLGRYMNKSGFVFLWKIARNIKRLDISNLCGDTHFKYYYDYQNIYS